MHDTESPDHARLFEIASEWRGYFTAADARKAGFSRFLLRHHVDRGRFVRVRRGIYRFRDYPSMPHDEVVEAIVEVGREYSIVTHESALELLELSDVIPNSIHITVPRTRRFSRPPVGVTLHTTTRPFSSSDLTHREGIRISSATRSIVDSLESGTDPEQIELAIGQALERGLTTSDCLMDAASGLSKNSRVFVEGTLERPAT